MRCKGELIIKQPKFQIFMDAKSLDVFTSSTKVDHAAPNVSGKIAEFMRCKRITFSDHVKFLDSKFIYFVAWFYLIQKF